MVDWIAKLLGRSAQPDHAKPLPAWALLFHSPFASSDDATSWLGGAPKTPGNFEWPKDTDGTPLHFIAQIDLASLTPEPQTGSRPPGLPAEGALLVFIGRSCACRILNAAQIARSQTLPLPEELESVRKHGFFGEGPAFLRRTVNPIAYLDTGDGRPTFLPERFKSPLDWIVNWGIAALEAQNVIDSLKIELSEAARFLAWWESVRQEPTNAFNANEVIRNKTAHYGVIERKAPEVVAALEAWRDLALSKPQDEAIDKDALSAILCLRLDLHDEMQPFMSKFIVAGSADAVWDAIRRQYPRLDHGEGYDELPSCYRPFVEMRETDWRGHRLFGIEPEFGNNGEDLRGYDCVISIFADMLLQTMSEHEYGFSVWCSHNRIKRGLFDQGRLIRHCAV